MASKKQVALIRMLGHKHISVMCDSYHVSHVWGAVNRVINSVVLQLSHITVAQLFYGFYNYNSVFHWKTVSCLIPGWLPCVYLTS